MVVVSSVDPLNVTLGGSSSLTWVPFREYGELFRRVTVKVSASPGCTRSEAERVADTELAISGLETVHLSSSADVPVAGEETTSPVAGSTSVSGIGSFSGTPLMSVPYGAGSAEVADDVVWSGSVI